jgi:hypothetical protein
VLAGRLIQLVLKLRAILICNCVVNFSPGNMALPRYEFMSITGKLLI